MTLKSTDTMERITRQQLADNFDEILEKVDNPPSFMVNQVRRDFGIGSYEEAKNSIPTDRFYSLVLNEVIEKWGQKGCVFDQKHIPFKTIESGYFEPEAETFGELTMI